MSIQATINQLEANGKLTRFVPDARGRPRRRLYLTKPALKDYVDDQSATNILVGRGYIKAALTKWTLGEWVQGNRKRGTFLHRLCPPPPEIWEIRVTEPLVRARLLGRFADPDTLILTRFHTRGLLGDKGSVGWAAAMTHCVDTWQDAFGVQPPFSGTTIHDYVTENCDDFPI